MGEINSFGELENLLQPFFYSSVTPLPEAPKGCPAVPKSTTIKGFISEDCFLGCYYNQEVIQCFPIDTKLSENHYSPKSHVPICVPDTPYTFPPRCLITCSSEFTHNQRASRGVRKILLGLDCTGVAPHYNLSGGNGALAIYDPIQRQVLKWISVPYPVTTIRIVNHFERGDATKPFYNGAMVAMVGIAAVGMLGGEVMIVDLGLDRVDKLQPSGITLFSSVSSQLHSKPYQTMLVEPFDRLIAMKRHHAINKNQLICLSVTTSDTEEPELADVFLYLHQDGTEIARFDKNDVSVTAVEYISNIGCLLIGFNFGGFQIWRVDDLSLQFSSSIPDSDLAILSFGFQQPIDDPKNFCYVWVLYGAEHLQQSHSHLDLYQLFFLDKSHIEHFGYIYENLQKCAKNLSITLEDVHLPRSSGDSDDGDSIGIDENDRFLVHPMRLWIIDELVFISWNVARLGVFYVGIFDLNQWYSSHTAQRIPTMGLCSFWVTIPVQRSGSYGIPWDFRLVPSSLVRWENNYKPESIHLFPASITFQGASLTSDGVFCFEHFGLQEKLIRYILRDGHTEMAEPAQLRHLCQTYGLQPVTSKIYEPETLSPEDIDRFYIFTALLESKRPALLVKMANIWLDGSFANVGCTIDLIINWVRNLALSVRYLAEEHWHNTLNPLADTLLPETKKFIGYSNFVWNSLYSLLKTLIRHDEVYNVSRIPALDDLKNSLEKLVQYSAAILMFCQAGILPSKDNVIDSLIESKEQRRAIVREALMNCDIIPDEMKQDHPYLVIDQMLANFGEDFVRREWNLEPAECIYPPRDAAYVVNMIMWKNVDVKLISRVMFYFIIDFMTATGCLGTQSLCSKLKGDFQSVIHLTPEEQAELFKLWEVDHGYIEDPLSYLCQSQKFYDRDANGAAWSTAATILTALKPDDVNTADLYRSGCPPLLGKLYINVMSASKEKFKWLTNEVCSEYAVVLAEPEMLQYFLKVTSQKGLLEEFIAKKAKRAPVHVVSELIAFLEKTSNFTNQNLLVTFYLKTDNYEKAHQVHKNMKAFWGDGLLLDSRQKLIWNNQLEMMKKLPQTKPQGKIHSFLNMKKTNDKAIKPVSHPPITIKPYRILELTGPTLNLKEFSKPSNLMSQYQMSPLRKYIPRTVLDPKSNHDAEENGETRNLNGSTNLSLNDSNNSEEGAGVSTANTPPRPRASISFDVESVLRTPTVDHRKKHRLSQPIRRTSEESMEESNLDIPEENTTSILKKGECSVRSKTLKTRFLDPTSGEEMVSSPTTDVTSTPQFPSVNSNDNSESAADKKKQQIGDINVELETNISDVIINKPRDIVVVEQASSSPYVSSPLLSAPKLSYESQERAQIAGVSTAVSPESHTSTSELERNIQFDTPSENADDEVEPMDVTEDELYVSVGGESNESATNDFVEANTGVLGNDVIFPNPQSVALDATAAAESIEYFAIAPDNIILPSENLAQELDLHSEIRQESATRLTGEKSPSEQPIESERLENKQETEAQILLAPPPPGIDYEKADENVVVSDGGQEREENLEESSNIDNNQQSVSESKNNNRDSTGTDYNTSSVGDGLDEAFVNITGDSLGVESDSNASGPKQQQQEVEATDETTGDLIFEKTSVTQRIVVEKTIVKVEIEEEEVVAPTVTKSKIPTRKIKVSPLSSEDKNNTVRKLAFTNKAAESVPPPSDNNDEYTEELFSSPSRVQQIKQEIASVKQEVISPIQPVSRQEEEDRHGDNNPSENDSTSIKAEDMSMSLFNSTELEVPTSSTRTTTTRVLRSTRNRSQLDDSLTGDIIVDKKTMLDMSISMIEEAQNVSSDQDSPNKSEKGNTEDEVFKSPVKRKGRAKKVKSESAASSSAEDNGSDISVTKVSTRTRRRSVRSSVTPESDAGGDGGGNARRLTRSQSRRLSSDGHESDQSFSGDDHNISLNLSSSEGGGGSSTSTKKTRTRKTSLKSVPETDEQNDDVKLVITRTSLRSRSKSESPARVLAPAPEPVKRKRRKQEDVMGYAPELSTVMEQSDIHSGASKSHLDCSVLNSTVQSETSVVGDQKRTSKRRKTFSSVEREDHDDSMSDISTTSTSSRRSSRRSMTPVNKTTAEKATAVRKRRKSEQAK